MTTDMTLEHQTWRAGTLTDSQLVQIAELHLAAFDPKGRTVDDYIEQRLRRLWQDGDESVSRNAVLHLISVDERIVAKAATFGRTINTPAGKRYIMGLSSVAAHPDYRGNGLGHAIVRAAFERVDDGEFTTGLFQTGRARSFYERLGCRVITNKFINSFDDNPNKNPWTDEVAMIYPGDSAWPSGTIDLLGPAY